MHASYTFKFCRDNDEIKRVAMSFQQCVLYRKSTSCTHVSELLYALVTLLPSKFVPPKGSKADLSGDELLVTLYKCQWVQPKKRKDCNTKMADANFEKHVYGQERKCSMQPIKDFDPRSPESIGTVVG